MQIAVAGVGVEFAGKPILENVTFTVSRGERWGVVGRNGSGKTTLFNVLTGALEPSSGSVSRASGLRVTLLEQQRETGAELDAWSAAALPFADLVSLERALEQQAARIGELGAAVTPDLLTRYDRDLERFAREGGYTYAARVDAVLHGLGFDPAEARSKPMRVLSGGEAGRIALARQLVAPADVLLLDEPTNHLDIETTAWLEAYLRELDASVLVISHDRAFLQNVVDHVLHIERGTATPYRGSYDAFVQQHAERRLAQQRQFEAQQRMIAAEEDYIRRNIAGQNSKQAKGRRKRLARVSRLSPPPGEAGSMALRIQPRDRGGNQVLVAENATVQLGARTLIEDFSARITRGEVVGLVGANGTGKSTLLRVIAGQRELEGGTLRVGESVDVAYYRQDMAQVPTGKTLFDIIHDLRPMWERGAVQSHLGRFGFSGAAALRTAESLSGGERARVALAMLMLQEAHFLLLDEPTNHLDVESIEALEDALEDFDGTVLLVSHDRELLRNTVTRVWSLEDAHISDFSGSFEEWEALRAQRSVEQAAREAEEKRVRDERARAEARKREQSAGANRSAQRALRTAVQQAETEVFALEQRIAELRELLHDPELYTSGEGARRAAGMQRELDDAEEALVLAIEAWTNASDTLAGG